MFCILCMSKRLAFWTSGFNISLNRPSDWLPMHAIGHYKSHDTLPHSCNWYDDHVFGYSKSYYRITFLQASQMIRITWGGVNMRRRYTSGYSTTTGPLFTPRLAPGLTRGAAADLWQVEGHILDCAFSLSFDPMHDEWGKLGAKDIGHLGWMGARGKENWKNWRRGASQPPQKPRRQGKWILWMKISAMIKQDNVFISIYTLF